MYTVNPHLFIDVVQYLQIHLLISFAVLCLSLAILLLEVAPQHSADVLSSALSAGRCALWRKYIS